MKRQHLFYKILVPLVLASVTQAVLFAFIVFVTGTPREISRSAEDRFENNLLTSVSLIDSRIQDIDPDFNGFQTSVVSRLSYRLTGNAGDNGSETAAFLADEEMKENFIGDITTALSGFVQINEAAGGFVVLAENAAEPLEYHGLFLYTPDGPGGQIVALRGYNKAITRGALRKSVNWAEHFTAVGTPGEFDWFKKPMEAGAAYPATDINNLCYWSFPFLLGDRSVSDPFIAVSVPLRFNGEVIGAFGVVYMTSDIIGSARPDRNQNVSLLLSSFDTEEAPVPGQFSIVPRYAMDTVNLRYPAGERVTLSQTEGFPDLWGSPDITYGGNAAIVALSEIPVYPEDTPYDDGRWMLAAIADSGSVFALSNRLVYQMIIILVVALLGTLICAALISHMMSKGLVRVIGSMDQNNSGLEVVPVIDDGTIEIYELSERLHETSVRFNDMMKELEEERRRYYLALMNSHGNFIDYNAVTDVLKSDSQRVRSDTEYGSDNPEETIVHKVTEHYLERVAAGEFCVREDISEVMKFMRGQSTEAVTVRFIDNSAGKQEIRYFTGKPQHIYDETTGKLLRTISCIRDITEEKRNFSDMMDNRKDQTTGFLKPDHTVSAVRDFLVECRVEEYFTVLMLTENYRYFTEHYGRFYSDALITEVSRAVSDEFPENNIITRECANEFMMILPLTDTADETIVTADLKRRLERLSARIAAIVISDDEPERLRLVAGVYLNNTGRYVAVAKQKAEIAAAAAISRINKAKSVDHADSQNSPVALFSEIETDFDFTEREDVFTILENVRDYDDYSIDSRNLNTFAFNILEKTSDMKSAVQILITRIAHEFDFDGIKIFMFERNSSVFGCAWSWSKESEANTDTNYSVPVSAADKNAFDGIMHGTDYIIIDRETLAYPAFLTNGLRFGDEHAAMVIPCPAGETFIGCAVFEAETESLEKSDTEQLKSLVKLLTAFMAKQRSTKESRAKSEFLSKMSHEIRTPMNAILGMTEIALTDSDISSSQESYLKKIEYSAKYLLTLINDILDMSRIESGKTHVEITDANLDDIILGLDSIIGTQCQSKGINYIVNDNVPVRKFKTDILKLNQILLNLLGNAVKFTPVGGKITLTVSLNESDNSAVKDPKKAVIPPSEESGVHSQCMTFIVSDTGIGIRKERIQKIFEPFEQESESTVRQYGGTGLGLPISGSYITLLGGDMQIESEPGAGTTFTFTIPVQIAEEAEGTMGGSNENDTDFKGRRILIAEDDELNMEIAQTLLEKAGFTVETAENGRIAVDKFAAAAPGYFDAILMDIRMPVLDGLAAAAEIRAHGKDDARTIPIIALSANAFAEDIQTSKQAGMNDHIIKPLDMRVLLRKLSEYIK